MILNVFSVYDSKAEAYLPPFFTPTPAVALRMFSEACSNESAQFHKHAGDYTLFEIGKFDDSRGMLVPLEVQINHGLALAFTNHPQIQSATTYLEALENQEHS